MTLPNSDSRCKTVVSSASCMGSSRTPAWEVQGYSIQCNIHRGSTQLNCQHCVCTKGQKRCCAVCALLRFETCESRRTEAVDSGLPLPPPHTNAAATTEEKRPQHRLPAALKIFNILNLAFKMGTKTLKHGLKKLRLS